MTLSKFRTCSDRYILVYLPLTDTVLCSFTHHGSLTFCVCHIPKFTLMALCASNMQRHKMLHSLLW